MKTYGDEDFIFLANELENQRNKQEEPEYENHINDGYIIIAHTKFPFKEEVISDDEFSMILPEMFSVMSHEMAQIKYPSQSRPDFILTNPETTINLTFFHKDDEVTNADIEEVKNAIQEIMMRLHPTSKVIDSTVIEVQERNIAYFDFVSSAIDTNVYNLMFFFSLSGTLLMGSFNCLHQDMDDWKEIFIQMLQSVKFLS